MTQTKTKRQLILTYGAIRVMLKMFEPIEWIMYFIKHYGELNFDDLRNKCIVMKGEAGLEKDKNLSEKLNRFHGIVNFFK